MTCIIEGSRVTFEGGTYERFSPDVAWYPIGDAPKDGSHILSWNGNYAMVVKWDGQDWVETNSEYFKPEPSHWMPLPEPPKP